ncbi:MAG: endolytic transglycosylase MltG [Acidimicrobiia bacterium]
MNDRPTGVGSLLRPALIAVTAVVVVGGAVLGARWMAGWVDRLGGPEAPAVPPGQPVEVEVPTGASAQQIGDLLTEVGVVSSRSDFEAATREAGASQALKAGTYQLTTGMQPEAVVAVLVEGPVIETYWITVPEGLRTEEILGRVAAQSHMTIGELAGALSSGDVASALRGPDAADDLASWEGLLFPDTYQMARNWSAAEVLEVLVLTMEQNFSQVDWANTRADSLTPYERLIVASLVESETRLDRDRPLVATVILNRLDAGMPLQIDATVLYALGVRGRSPTPSELEIDSLYNTYIYPGLPPTPISAPGAASLAAVAAAVEADYLYFVLTGSDGSHSFTSDYEEFLRWKEEAQEQGLF